MAGFIARQGGGAAGPQAAHDLETAKRSVQQLLLNIATSIIGSDVASDQPLMEAGLDSIGAVEFRNAVQSQFMVELPATMTFDYPTVQTMAGFIAGRMAPLEQAFPLGQLAAAPGWSQDNGSRMSEIIGISAAVASLEQDSSSESPGLPGQHAVGAM